MNSELQPPVKPTKAELVILNVLWKNGPSTVRVVHDMMPGTNGSGYTTILKLLQIMHRKGLVVRNDSQRAHVYQPVSSKADVQSQLTSDLIQRVFDGSPSQLVVQALGNTSAASKDELEKIRKLLNDLEAQQPDEE